MGSARLPEMMSTASGSPELPMRSMALDRTFGTGLASRGSSRNAFIGLIAEPVTDQLAKADPALNRIWRNDEDGCAILPRPKIKILPYSMLS